MRIREECEGRGFYGPSVVIMSCGVGVHSDDRVVIFLCGGDNFFMLGNYLVIGGRY